MDKLIKSIFPMPSALGGGGGDGTSNVSIESGNVILTVNAGINEIPKYTGVIFQEGFAFSHKLLDVNSALPINSMIDIYDTTWWNSHNNIITVYKKIGEQKLYVSVFNPHTGTTETKTVLSTGFSPSYISCDNQDISSNLIIVYNQDSLLRAIVFDLTTNTLVVPPTTLPLPSGDTIGNYPIYVDYINDDYFIVYYSTNTNFKVAVYSFSNLNLIYSYTFYSQPAIYIESVQTENLKYAVSFKHSSTIVCITYTFSSTYDSLTINRSWTVDSNVSSSINKIFLTSPEPNLLGVSFIKNATTTSTYFLNITTGSKSSELPIVTPSSVSILTLYAAALNGMHYVFTFTTSNDSNTTNVYANSFNTKNNNVLTLSTITAIQTSQGRIADIICYQQDGIIRCPVIKTVANYLLLTSALIYGENFEGYVGLALDNIGFGSNSSGKVILEGFLNGINNFLVGQQPQSPAYGAQKSYLSAVTATYQVSAYNARPYGVFFTQSTSRIFNNETSMIPVTGALTNIYDVFELEKRSPTYSEAVALGIWNNRELRVSGTTFVVPSGVYFIGVAIVGLGGTGVNAPVAIKYLKVSPGQNITYSLTSNSASCLGITATTPGNMPSGNADYKWSATSGGAQWIIQHGPDGGQGLRGNSDWYELANTTTVQERINIFKTKPLGFITVNEINQGMSSNNQPGSWGKRGRDITGSEYRGSDINGGFGGRGGVDDRFPGYNTLGGNGGFGGAGGGSRKLDNPSATGGNGGFGACGGTGANRGGNGGTPGGGGGNSYYQPGDPGSPGIVFIW